MTRALFQGVQKMRGSSTYQAILAEGRAEGVVRARQDAILDQLQERFGAVPPEVEARGRAATDPDRLRAALRQTLYVPSPGELTL